MLQLTFSTVVRVGEVEADNEAKKLKVNFKTFNNATPEALFINEATQELVKME